MKLSDIYAFLIKIIKWGDLLMFNVLLCWYFKEFLHRETPLVMCRTCVWLGPANKNLSCFNKISHCYKNAMDITMMQHPTRKAKLSLLCVVIISYPQKYRTLNELN